MTISTRLAAVINAIAENIAQDIIDAGYEMDSFNEYAKCQQWDKDDILDEARYADNEIGGLDYCICDDGEIINGNDTMSYREFVKLLRAATNEAIKRAKE